MNFPKRSVPLAAILAVCVLASACAHKEPPPITSSYQPGPNVGRTTGAAVGAAAGNVAGAAVGFGEGAVGEAGESFDNTTYTVRRWRTERTSDGRTIQVPEDILVDKYGRPVHGRSTPVPAQPAQAAPATAPAASPATNAPPNI